MRIRIPVFASVLASLMAAASPVLAAHHLWRVQQVYSNASGSTQFIELETTTAGRTGETSLGAFTVTSGGNTIQLQNLSGTNSQWLLIGTANIAGLPGGVPPDIVIPPNFFATGGGTIVYASGVDTFNYGAVPTDGVHALVRDPNALTVTTGVNQPTTAAGVMGQLNQPAAPALPMWGIAAAIGALLLAGSGLLRFTGRGRTEDPTRAAT